MSPSIRFLIFAILIGISSGSCGGSDGTTVADGGLGGTGISYGKITSFGSIFVNGVEFSTDKADILVDGAPASEADLKLGMIVKVVGKFDKNGETGRADRVVYEEFVRGPVGEIEFEEETFIVLGRTISIGDDTIFEGVSFETLSEGDFIEVSAIPGAGGTNVATRIELKLDFDFEISGAVKDLNEIDKTFKIDDILISFTQDVLDDIPGDALNNGMLVEVESQVGIVDGVLIASRIEPEEAILPGTAGLRVEMEGVINAFTSATDFKVNGIPVRTDMNTTYEHGFGTDLALGAKVEVEGVLEESGVLRAFEIEFRVDNAVEIEANVEGVNVPNRTLVLLGIEVKVNNLTQFRDSSDVRLTAFTLKDVQVGDELEVSALLGQDGTVTATRVWRTNEVSDVSLEGPVTDFGASFVTILGVMAIPTEETEFLDSDELPISKEDFFSQIAIGGLVGVEGTLSPGNIIEADEMELEN
jgi:hypothetical protein